MKSITLALLFSLCASANAGANDAPLPKEIPTAEKEFVATINGFDKSQIIEQLGEPSNKNDITNGKTGKLEASIWHYHNLNTDEKGEYYKTTELDFINDKVVLVVFMNDADESTTYDLKPDTKLPTPGQ